MCRYWWHLIRKTLTIADLFEKPKIIKFPEKITCKLVIWNIWHNRTVFKQQPYDPVWQQDWKVPSLTKWVTGQHWIGCHGCDTQYTHTFTAFRPWAGWGEQLSEWCGPFWKHHGVYAIALHPSCLLLNIFTRRTLQSSGGATDFVGATVLICWGCHRIYISHFSLKYRTSAPQSLGAGSLREECEQDSSKSLQLGLEAATFSWSSLCTCLRNIPSFPFVLV